MSGVNPERLTPEAAIAGLGIAHGNWAARGWHRTNELPSLDGMGTALYEEVRDGVVQQLDEPGLEDDFRVTTGYALVPIGSQERPKGAPEDFYQLTWDTRPFIFVNLEPQGDEEYANLARQATLLLGKQGWNGRPLSREAGVLIRDFLNGSALDLDLSAVDLEGPPEPEPPTVDPTRVQYKPTGDTMIYPDDLGVPSPPDRRGVLIGMAVGAAGLGYVAIRRLLRK